MTDFDFLFTDRVQKIKQINQEYNLEKKGYISFSGGLDSTVLSTIIDFAIPNNQIPRVFINTGIEYRAIVDFVHSRAKIDKRIVEIKPHKNIKEILEQDGYPFKSKEHAHKVHLLQNGSTAPSVLRYFELNGEHGTMFSCPKKLLYQNKNQLPFKVSDLCCTRLKKEPAKEWSKANNRNIAILGIRRAEGGQRKTVQNCLYFYRNKLEHFSPLLPCPDSFIYNAIKYLNIDYCILYRPPYNFRRTGCKGCPFAIDLKKQLETMKMFLPHEANQCEYIFAPVYEEYRRIGYRLPKIDEKH